MHHAGLSASNKQQRDQGSGGGRRDWGSRTLSLDGRSVSTTMSSDTGNADILIVDDNVVNQKILANILKQMGLEYDIARDGKQAVEAYVAHPRKYGVVLMDTIMPVMDGFEATREIRKRELGSGPFCVTW